MMEIIEIMMVCNICKRIGWNTATIDNTRMKEAQDVRALSLELPKGSLGLFIHENVRPGVQKGWKVHNLTMVTSPFQILAVAFCLKLHRSQQYIVRSCDIVIVRHSIDSIMIWYDLWISVRLGKHVAKRFSAKGNHAKTLNQARTIKLA